MLSYRHAYHAGNHADALKHLVLASCLEHICRKETPYRYVDTHAGAGAYSLGAGYSAERGEWKSGYARLRSYAEASGTEAAPEAVGRYLDLIDAFSRREGADAYPGSPAVAAEFLRPADRAVLFELHPADHAALDSRFAADARFGVRRSDGLAGLRSLLPPPTRRAVILIDPSYETRGEYDAVADCLADALRRFATGIFLVWYPMLEREESRAFPDRVLAVHRGRRCRAELRVKAPRADGRGMRGSGLVVLNPPWTLRKDLEESLPYLSSALGDEDPAGDLYWDEPQTPDATRRSDPVSKDQTRPEGRIVQ